MAIKEDVLWLKSLSDQIYDGCSDDLSTDIDSIYSSSELCTTYFTECYVDGKKYALSESLVFEYDPETDTVNIYEYGRFSDSEFGIPAEYCKTHLIIDELFLSISSDVVRFHSSHSSRIDIIVMHTIPYSEEYWFQMSTSDAHEQAQVISDIRNNVIAFVKDQKAY